MSIFFTAIADRQTKQVSMNDVQFVSFTGTSRAIATQNLNGCTAVALFSRHGAILAHIPPVPYPSPDPNIGLQNLDRKMDRFCQIYQENRNLFPNGTTSLIVGAAIGNNPTLQHHLSRIRVRLQSIGLAAPALKLYEVNFSQLRSRTDGTVLIDARSGVVAVYVEDRLLPL